MKKRAEGQLKFSFKIVRIVRFRKHALVFLESGEVKKIDRKIWKSEYYVNKRSS